MYAFNKSANGAGRDEPHGVKRDRQGQESTTQHSRPTASLSVNALAIGAESSRINVGPDATTFELKEDEDASGADGDGVLVVEEALTIEGEEQEDDTKAPQELTKDDKKKLRKKARMDKVITRNTAATPALQTIDFESLTPGPWNVAWEQDPELLCCYNWYESQQDGNSTIFVPGEPPKWSPPELPYMLDKDTGFSYSDYNYVRQPGDPYSPMFHALGVMKPDFQFMDVDVIAERNNLRVLLEFASGKGTDPFRLDIYLVFNTLIFVKRSTSFWKHSTGLSENSGHGFEFEKHFTRHAEGMEDATSHYRAIRYPIGPLNVVVRFEADAYYDGSDELTPSEASAVRGNILERPRFDYRLPIRVMQKGHMIPMAQMAELKTISYKPDECRNVECMDQLWFGRTTHLFTGVYEKETGHIKRVKYDDKREKLKLWEEKQQENLQRLVGLLSRLRTVLKNQPGPNRAAILVREDRRGPLEIRSMEVKRHVIGREFFLKHWERRQPQPAARPYTGPPRGQWNGNRGRGYGRGYGPSNGRFQDSHFGRLDRPSYDQHEASRYGRRGSPDYGAGSRDDRGGRIPFRGRGRGYAARGN